MAREIAILVFTEPVGSSSLPFFYFLMIENDLEDLLELLLVMMVHFLATSKMLVQNIRV
jgi:hypothetical protein